MLVESKIDRRIKELEDNLYGFMKRQIRINDIQHNINDSNTKALKLLADELEAAKTRSNDDGK